MALSVRRPTLSSEDKSESLKSELDCGSPAAGARVEKLSAEILGVGAMGALVD